MFLFIKTVKDFIKHAWQKLIYQDYYNVSIFNAIVIEKVLLFIGDDEYWNTWLNNLKKEMFSLTGLAGLGLGFLFYITQKTLS